MRYHILFLHLFANLFQLLRLYFLYVLYLCSAFFRFIEDHVDQCHRMEVIKAEASTSKLNANPMLDIASRIYYLNRNLTRCPKNCKSHQ